MCPRDGSDVYNVPSGTYGIEDTTIESARYNAFVDDVAQDLNHPRPVLAGGTGAASARDALIGLGAEFAQQLIVNYDSDPFQGGSFYSTVSATSAPVASHAFAGIAVITDASNILIEAYDQTVQGRKYLRVKTAGVWGAWKSDGRTVIGSNEGIDAAGGDMFFGVSGTAPNSQFIVNNKADASGANVLAVTKAGRMTGNGIIPPGAVMDFAMPTPPAGWLACDGNAVSRATYADLFAAIGGTWGVGDGSTTFNLPNMVNRYRRHRDNSTLAGVVGTLQNPCNLSHTHPITGSTGAADRNLDHLHTGSTASMNRNNVHSHSLHNSRTGGDVGTYSVSESGTNGVPGSVGGGGQFGAPSGLSINAIDTNHEHGFTTNGADRSIDHLHGINFTSQGGSADGPEVRPYSATVLTCIKT